MDFHGPKTQITESDTATLGTTVLYTVPTAKKLFLISGSVSGLGATGEASLVVRNGSAVVQYVIGSQITLSAVGIHIASRHEPSFPMELPATWDIAVISDTAAHVATGSIFGMETNA